MSSRGPDHLQPVTASTSDQKALDQVLRFGDHISFYYPDSTNPGFVHVDAAGGDFSSLLVSQAAADQVELHHGLDDFKQAVFQVHAQCKYKAAKKLKKQLVMFRKKNRAMESLTLEQALLKDTSGQLEKLRRLAEDEAQDNELEQTRRSRDEVVYGAIVQLWHPAQESYMRVSSDVTSTLEPNNMRIELDPNTSKHAWFKIMPRFKVRAEGEPIRMGDQIVLESIKTTGQFVNVTSRFLSDETISPHRRECNVSVSQTALTMLPHLRPLSNAGENAIPLRGGDLIQLFHKESSSFMAAEGCFFESALREDVHMRIREADPRRPHRMEPPTSAVTFWQIELASHPSMGSLVEWDAFVRLKHVPSGRYLSLDDEGEAHLIEDAAVTSTIFVFTSVILERPHVVLESYTRIQHYETKLWLHPCTDTVDLDPEEYTRSWAPALADSSLNNALHSRMAAITWDKASLRKLRGLPQQRFDDAFIVHGVPEHSVRYVARVRAMVPVLQQFIKVAHRNPLDRNFFGRIYVALETYIKFMLVRGETDRKRQKLLRNMGVVELAVQAMQALLKPYNARGLEIKDLVRKEHIAARLTIQRLYTLLETYATGNSRKNELYLTAHVSFFHQQLGYNLNVEKMLSELIRDNDDVIDAIEDEQIEQYVQLLKTRRNPAFLDLFSVLCSVEGAANSVNQEKLTNVLLVRENLMYRTEDGQNGDILIKIPGEASVIPLKQLHREAQVEDSPRHLQLLFLEKQLDLFGELCLQRCERSIDVISKTYLGWNQVFRCVQDASLPPRLRQMYVDLMVFLFVDVGNNKDVLDGVSLVFEWDKLHPNPYANAAQDRTESITGAKFVHFPELSKWILSVLNERNGSLVAEQEQENEFLESVLKLTHCLVEFGYYVAPEDINTLMKPLLVILQGTNDVPNLSTFNNGLARAESKATRRQTARSRAGSKVAQPPGSWSDAERKGKTSNNTQIVRVKREALNVVDKLVNLCLTVRLQNFLYDYKQLNAPTERRQTRAASRANKPLHPTALTSGPTLTPEQMRALQSILDYREDKDVDMEDALAPHASVVRHYIDEVIDRSNYILPEWRPSMARYRTQTEGDFAEIMLDLAQYDYAGLACKALQLLNRVFSASDDLFNNIVKAQVLLMPESIDLKKTLEDEMPVIRRLGAGQIEEGKEAQDFNRRLKRLTDACMLDREHPHAVNQTLIINNGIVPVLFDVLDAEDQPSSVIAHTFNLLEALAKDNLWVQQEFYDRLDRILDIETKEHGWEDDMARAITEVFADNERLSLALKTDQIEQMMEHLAVLKGQGPDLVTTVRSIVKCEELDVPLPRNQNLVMKSLMQRFDETLGCTFVDVEGDADVNAKRLQLLRYRGMDQETLTLQRYHANMIGLVAHCAEGYNRFIESTCMTFFSLDELVQVLNDPEIAYWIKSEYLLFLYFVYLETAVDTEISGVNRLSYEPNLWRSLGDLADKVISNLYNDTAPYLSENEERLAFDCFLPVLTFLVKEVYKKGIPQIDPYVKRMYDVVRSFASRCVDRLYSQEQVEEVSACLVAMSRTIAGSTSEELMSRLDTRMELTKGDVALSHEYKDYLRSYAEQIKLNKRLNDFATRVRVAYGGLNNIATQLPHSEFADANEVAYCEPVEDDEYLPLGPGFQTFVDLFVKYKSPNNKVAVGLRFDDIRSLVRCLEASRKWSPTLDAKDHDLQEVLDIRVLQILRAIVHNEIKLEREVEATQNAIAQAQAVLPVASMLSVKTDDVVREALALLVVLLADGNKQSQESFLAHFLNTREETFFDDIQLRVNRSIESRVERRALEQQLSIAKNNRAELQATMRMGATAKKGMQDMLHQHNDISSPGDIELRVMERQPSAIPMIKSEEERSPLEDEGNIELVLRVLQYMCEGHFLPLQEYLRTQPDNVRKINLVDLAVQFLHVLTEEITLDSIEIIIQTVETLVEFAQGCPDNQRCIFDARVTDDINSILRSPELRTIEEMDPEDKSEHDMKPEDVLSAQEKVAHLLLACGNLVLSMMENSDEETRETAQEIEDTLDIKRVFETLYRYGHLQDQGVEWVTDEDNDEDPVTATEIAYAYFNILLRLQDFTGQDYRTSKEHHPSKASQEDKDIYDAMSERAVSIEILRDGKLHKVHILNQWKDAIRSEVKHQLVWEVDRSSPSNRLHDFVDRCKNIMADIQYQRRMEGWSTVTWTISKFSRTWANLMLLMTIIINIFILATWKAPVSWADPEPEYSISWYDEGLAIMGTIHIVFTLLVATAYFLLNPPSFSAAIQSIFGDEDTIQATYPTFMATSLTELLDDSPGTKTSPFSLMFLYHVALIVFSILGVFYHGYFYCFALFHIVVGNAILVRVIRAVTQNSKSLLWLAVLLVIVIYVYSLISFAFLRKSFDEAEGAYCQTAFQCFITSLRLGLISGGGLGEALPAETMSFVEPAVKTIFDLSYFIIVTIIGLNLVFGVIVDTFSELRDEAHEINEARNSECFISGLKADEFERYGNGFGPHVNHEQNMWHYLAFFLHLAEKDETEYTSHESYVAEYFNQGEIKFFPQNRAMALRRDDEQGLEERLSNVETTMQEVLDRITGMMDERSQRKKALKRMTSMMGEDVQEPGDGDDYGF
eukprot:m.276491 g.276491  ORF g.276491 m.276491 type:complete len:2614 (+) comp17698_c0_seq3:125-7966(+)